MRAADRTECPLLAKNRHPRCDAQCPLLGVKRTFLTVSPMCGYDPKRTSHSTRPRVRIYETQSRLRSSHRKNWRQTGRPPVCDDVILNDQPSGPGMKNELWMVPDLMRVGFIPIFAYLARAFFTSSTIKSTGAWVPGLVRLRDFSSIKWVPPRSSSTAKLSFSKIWRSPSSCRNALVVGTFLTGNRTCPTATGGRLSMELANHASYVNLLGRSTASCLRVGLAGFPGELVLETAWDQGCGAVRS